MLKRWKNTTWFKVLSNKYVVAVIVFAFWMAFLDRNSIGLHMELSERINDLEEAKAHYESELEQNRRELEELESDPEKLEKFAREKYWMHKEGEEVFLIEVAED